MFHLSLSRWAKVEGVTYDQEIDEADIGGRTLADYLPEGMSPRMQFPDMRSIRNVLNHIKPDKEGIYPVCSGVEIDLPGTPPFVDFFPTTKKNGKAPPPPPKLSTWQRFLRWCKGAK